MRLDRFDLNLLVALDALLHERNVTKASKRIHIGQSAASAALARLREYFQDDLLVLVGRQLMLTPLAESLIVPVHETLQQAKATLARRPNFDASTAKRRFTVYASDYVTTVALAKAVQRIAVLAPQIVIDIRTPGKDIFEQFDRGDIDLLILPKPYMSRLNHIHQAWFQDEQVCMVWQGNTDIGDSLSKEQYIATSHVAIHFNDERTLMFNEWFLPPFAAQRQVEATVDNFSTLPLLIIGTQRIVSMHRRHAEHFAQYLPLRIVQAQFEMPPIVEMLCWPRHLEHDPAHQWLRGVLIDQEA
jgi:LysR family transcriptional regulator, nod-box dependent transcriptional activator